MKKVRRIESAFELARILLALVIAYALSLLCLVLVTEDPIEAMYMFAVGPLTSTRRIGQVIVKFIPYALCGVGMCFMYASNRFSMFGEGSYLMSGCFVTIAAFALEPYHLPLIVMVPILLVVGAFFGGLIGFTPAILGAKLKLNELVTSTMLNYVCLYLTLWILKIHLADPDITFFASKILPDNVRLPQIIDRSTIHAGLFIAPVFIIIAAIVYFRTRLGFSIRICGSNPNFAKFSGINFSRSIIWAHTIGGALVGIGACVDLLGIYDRFLWTEITNYGFYGLVSAVLARKNPLFAPLGALLLAYMHTGASILNYTSEVPIEFVQIMQALLILLISAQTFLRKTKNKVIFKDSHETISKEEKLA